MESYRSEFKIKEMKSLISELNIASDMYYNTSNTIMNDKEWDIKLDRLKELEKETGIVLNNSPSVNVGYEVKSKLEKVKHEYILRSLGKTQDKNELNSFIGNKKAVGMLKLDGLTTDLIYKDGELIEGSTRGNGEIGEDITHNIKTYINVPKKIKYKGKIHIVGESIITYNTFNEINKNGEYKNPRNLVSGSVRQLDSKICAKRKVKFLSYNVFGKEFISKVEELKWLEEQGFDVVDYKIVNNLNKDIEELKSLAAKKQIPIDGLVFTYDDKSYGESLGNTAHHPNHSMAFKFYDEEEETLLKEVQWQVGRTGVITPVAIFDPVELDGTEVAKATLHNVSTMKKFKLGLGDKITVYKANQIIPQIRENLTQSDTLEIPSKCPVCGHETNIKISDNAEFLMCENPNCKAQLVQKIKHYCSRNAMNIEGLSEKTIEKFIEKGYLSSIEDIYKLQDKTEIKRLEGFGVKSFNNLVKNIEKSKECKLENFIYALGIPNVGKTTAKTFVEFIKGDNPYIKLCNIKFLTVDDLLKMKDCGEIVANSIVEWFHNKDNINLVSSFIDEIDFIIEEKVEVIAKENPLKGMKVYPTGKFTLKKSELKSKLEELGAIVEIGYKKSLDYLIVGSDISKSGKVDKAKRDNVKLFTEEELMKLI
ncbi:NAD-dependent DNA ligase LigA [Clostridium perfringens]|jgi:DNA ligase (NAD+)|uniref:DNA ligase n=1 Tax=Clostridium perfringens TaxID=1502 RepID=A0AAW4J4B0_CLOPF|nr:NAD-dependent DNA ligase LigA [Clostridium perfringens]MBO3356141.1 NAD-dependent DNA ligase LigA [Clostridium perfringens]MBO3359518.1 NAD-dependent DNA ligase LigA [Clostridium perfringens]